MSSKMVSPFCVLDFETGGLDSNKNAVTEVAMIAITGDTLEEIARFESYAKYQYNVNLGYDDRALQITGINIEDLIEMGLPIGEFVDKMIEVFTAANKTAIGKFSKVVLVGHNITFDIDFLIACFEYCKKDLSKYVAGRTTRHGKFEPYYIDTIWLSRMKWQADDQMENFKLGTAVEKAGLELSDAHRAMNDVIANKELFVSFINDLRFGDGSGTGVISKKIRFRNHFQF